MKLLILSLVLVILTSMPATASERYFALEAGVWLPHKTDTFNNSFNSTSVDYSPGWVLGGIYGISFSNGLSPEYELCWRQADAKRTGDGMWSVSSMFNLWWDIQNDSDITPYFGGGFGVAHAHTSSPGPVDNSGYGICYQAGGGVDIKLDRKLSLDVGYRYFGLSDTSSNHGVGSVDLSGSSITTGLRIRF